MADSKTLTYRDLLTMAHERLGSAAASLKTRDELLRALGLAPAEPPQTRPVVTRDFFVSR